MFTSHSLLYLPMASEAYNIQSEISTHFECKLIYVLLKSNIYKVQV